jgi:putative Holliday junction resolvase
VGSVRVGVALSDPVPMLASPLATLPRDERHGRDLDRLVALVAEYGVVEIVVGLPRTLAGGEGAAAGSARRYAETLASRAGWRGSVPIRLHDERLTTVSAERVLREQGVRGKRARSVIDQAAAVEILQSWLDRRPAAAGSRDERGLAP